MLRGFSVASVPCRIRKTSPIFSFLLSDTFHSLSRLLKIRKKVHFELPIRPIRSTMYELITMQLKH